MILSLHPTSVGPLAEWPASSGTQVTAVASNDGNGSYCATSVNGRVQEWLFPATAVPVGQMVMGARLVVVARATTPGARINLSLRRGTGPGHRRSNAPRETSFSVGVDAYREYSVLLTNQPFPARHGSSAAWPAGGAAFAEHAFGVVATDHGLGEIRVTEARLDIIYRPEVTAEQILSGERSQPWQWVEIEGVRWVPSTAPLPEGSGDYYYGFDHRPVAGALLANEMFRSGRWNQAKGREEIESARVVLLDVREVAYEHGAGGADAPLHVFPQGFFTWLLAYGDRDRVHATRMTDSSGLAFNSLKGLDPQWESSGGSNYGRAFTVVDASSFPAAGGEDSYCYVGREAIWYGIRDGLSFGTPLDEGQLLRGRFGSQESAHEWNRLTGVYPQVSDHPVSWTGRWVRIWTCFIDESTGLPFPMSVAIARTYCWSSHAQEVGSGRVNFSVQLGSAEALLQGPVPAIRPARCRRLIGNSNEALWVRGRDGTGGWHLYIAALDNTTSWRDVSELCSYLVRQLSSSGFPDPVAVGLVGDRVAIRFTSSLLTSYEVACTRAVAKMLGFELDVVPAEQQTSSPTTWVAWAPNAPSAVVVGGTRAYLEEGDGDEWPAASVLGGGGKIPGTTDKLCLVFSGGQDKVVRDTLISLTATDAVGDYVLSSAKAPSALQEFIAQEEPVICSGAGEDPPTVAPGLLCDRASPHEFFLRALTSTGFGVNGAWDVWPRGFGLGVPSALIDADAWVATGQALKVKRSWLLLESTPLQELLEEELSLPTGLMLRQDQQGRFQLTSIEVPSTTNPQVGKTILEEHWLARSVVRQEHSSRTIVNELRLECDYNPIDGKYLTTLRAVEPNSVDRYGLQSRALKHRGERTRTTGGGSTTAYFPALAHLFFARFAWEMPTISGSINQRGLALAVGDSVRVWHSLLQNVQNGSSLGIANKPAQIVKLDKNAVKGACDVELLADGVASKFGGYAPAAHIDSYDPVGQVATCAAHRFTPAGGAVDASFFSGKDRVMIFRGASPTPLVSTGVIIGSVSGNAITLESTPGFALASGDIIVWEEYESLDSSQRTKGYVHASDGGWVDGADTVSAWSYAP